MSTLFSYLIKIYAEADLSQKALNVFYKMLEFNVKPLPKHLNHILELVVSHRDFIMPIFNLFKIAYKYGVFPNTKSYNILMGAFCLNGDLSIAYKLFKKMFERGVMPDVESYRILMQGVCKKSQVNRAVDLLEDMLNKRFVPDSLSYTTLLNSLCRKKKLRKGRAMDAVKIFHGECTSSGTSSTINLTYPDTDYHQYVRQDDMEGMLRDAFNMHSHGEKSFPPDFITSDDCDIGENVFCETGTSSPDEEPNEEAAKFYNLLNDMNEELYEGPKYSKLSFCIRLFHLKCLGGWTGNSFTMLLKFLREMFSFAKTPSSVKI
ncbi:hypothetical protein PVK06_040708 [Gossypium arboreum]|uniref:Pentatricopeptide repeat-containing protein n=1 Tax=Gossypium arboreum TaxID=29729 RepID=A0ABR0N6H4_GOSAR|nr:hypothetical protein PVK06_040708 [Gossypium arboreum]